MLLTSLTAGAQRYFNLTADEVRVDSLLPVFHYKHPLGYHYADSTYTVTLSYPEYIPMSEADVQRYQSITATPLPATPVISQAVSVERKQGELLVSFVPLVCRDGQYLKLVSFMLQVHAKAKSPALRRANRASATDGRYADHSVLSTGRWVKIGVPSSGIYQLTSDLVTRAGFSDITKVKVYGYGGAWQPEKLTADYLKETDDLSEVPLCEVGGKRLFYAVGPVTWNSSNQRLRNPYSSYGCYFLTESDDEGTLLSESDFMQRYYPLADDYNTLYEVDNYAWYHGGRNLYDATEIAAGSSKTYTLASTGTTADGTLTVALTAEGGATVSISLNDTELGSLAVSTNGQYESMRTATRTFSVTNLQASNQITLAVQAGSGKVRLDYLSIHADAPAPAPDLTAASFPAPELIYGIYPQDHHADTAVDMVIIIPTSQQLLAQAERLKVLHEKYDNLRVRIVPADELFNEFSSGTPDANAYRRYLKMLYDRAETDADMPRYLLLLGDGAWDNRMLSSAWSGYSPDDFLLCYESDNSYSATYSYVTDDYFCLLDDDEGADMLTAKSDVGVGRISARTADEAAVVVDKIASYLANDNAGAWQNLLCFMGDDGDNNNHMQDAELMAEMVETDHPTYQVRRIMWDAYTRESSATGNSYPDVTRLIRQQMQQGALLMNYSGHGRADAMSHEYVIRLTDFENTSPRLPLWVTASCDIMPFDGQEENFGETAMFNKKGGSVAFFGTTRTVFQPQNRIINMAFLRRVLSRETDGRLVPLGEAARLAKNDLVGRGTFMGYNSKGEPIYSTDLSENKLQYTLLGDPAMRLAAPTRPMTIETINNVPVSSGSVQKLGAGSTATVSGFVATADGQVDTAFDGVVTAVVRDASELITCKLNDTSEASVPFTYYDRPNVIFNGSDKVEQGRFTFSFAVPKDISYSDLTGLINVYAVSSDKTTEASGICEQLVFGSAESANANETGPSIYCYLNSTSFTNGGSVNPTPYFVAQLNDEDGINATGSGIGHDLELIIDGDMMKTYSLNDYFQYDFGSFTSGSVGYSIPELSYGEHRLLFRAWDVLNNSSTAELTFNVVKGLEPRFFDVECTQNPASTTTSFRILHDRTGSNMDVALDVFDISGRHLWSYSEGGVSTDNSYTVDWDLTVDGGRRLQTGVYLYRLRISSDGSTYATKAKKLIVLTHK